MPDLATKMSLCRECTQLRERYARASARREWAKADLIAAGSSHDENAIKSTQVVKEDAVREWEVAKAELEAHVNAHNVRVKE